MKRIVTGIQPTGTGSLHMGNYFGAIKPLIEIINGTDAFVMVADTHATTVDFCPSKLREASLNTAATLYACGVDKSLVFKQSCVPQHYELATYLSHLSTIGPLERMTQFKDKSQKSQNNNSIGFGLLSYPVLMAADIIAYNATHVTVGKDQHQHLQLTCDLVNKLNNKIGYDAINIPKMILSSNNSKIMDILNPDKKMSKSAENQNGVLYISDGIDIASKKIKKSVTDSKPYFEGSFDEQTNGVKNLVRMLSDFTNISLEDICIDMEGKRYSELKNMLIEQFDLNIVPIQKNIDYMLSNKDDLIKNLIEGNERACSHATSTVSFIRNKLGLGL